MICEYYKEYDKKYRYNNKNKVTSRFITARFLRNKKNKYSIDFFCKNCNSFDNLQLHHELYPTSVKKVKKALEDGKIYFLCEKCHKTLHRKVYKFG